MASTNRPATAAARQAPRSAPPARTTAPKTGTARTTARTMPTHTTQEVMITNLARRMEVPKTEAKAWYDAVRMELQGAITKDRAFYWKDFGRFVVKLRQPRAGRNPRTGEELKIPARNILGFKAAPLLAKAL